VPMSDHPWRSSFELPKRYVPDNEQQVPDG
jgi:hypothetical protein